MAASWKGQPREVRVKSIGDGWSIDRQCEVLEQLERKGIDPFPIAPNYDAAEKAVEKLRAALKELGMTDFVIGHYGVGARTLAELNEQRRHEKPLHE